MDDFDPDAYLAETEEFDPEAYLKAEREFDPDVFLAETTGTPLREFIPAPAGTPEREFVPTTKEAPEPRELTFSERLTGLGELGLSLATGATGGTLGLLGGFLSGLAGEIAAGRYGTQEGAENVLKKAESLAKELTYAPRTEAGIRTAAAVGEVLEPIEPALTALAPMAPQLAAGTQMARVAAAPATTRVSAATRRAPIIGRKAPEVSPEEARRRELGREVPVPFTGERALTKGQASQEFSQLQFEKEAAKLGEVGAPLRERIQNQTIGLLENFDALIDRPTPIRISRRDVGQFVTKALEDKANVAKTRINKAYAKAREAGEMAESVEMGNIPSTLVDIDRFAGVSPNVAAIRREAIRLGAVTEDESGNLIPGRMSLEDAELFRQFVNEATDFTDGRQSRIAKQVKSSIDSATEGKGGDLYKNARKMYQDYVSEFENVGLTAKLLKTKPGTDDRAIAVEDVYSKVISLAPVDEMNQVRASLLKAGPEGKQAWADLKSLAVREIKDSIVSPSRKDVISPDKLNRIIGNLDRSGKLDALFGKKQAQEMRDLAEISSVIYTAPPGAVNASGTSAALLTALGDIAAGNMAGAAVGTKQALSGLLKWSKNRKLKARIKEALKEPKPKD